MWVVWFDKVIFGKKKKIRNIIINGRDTDSDVLKQYH